MHLPIRHAKRTTNGGFLLGCSITREGSSKAVSAEKRGAQNWSFRADFSTRGKTRNSSRGKHKIEEGRAEERK